jgi:hypothetical protein
MSPETTAFVNKLRVAVTAGSWWAAECLGHHAHSNHHETAMPDGGDTGRAATWQFCLIEHAYELYHIVGCGIIITARGRSAEEGEHAQADDIRSDADCGAYWCCRGS